ncbi:Caudovirus prohead protease [Poriferisphaera corsica]|uniref:Caudovirus prohead protease n=1 Tax=Poriferisphaera corsica TaxID=2528020 RepID=A0A517YU37_9BACT|nr:HK97 family phage prohead protease [Poriferisphaera corsica]QDU33760.1 Caudovirus prohead protease [Poriferisphaera corsica]
MDNTVLITRSIQTGDKGRIFGLAIPYESPSRRVTTKFDRENEYYETIKRGAFDDSFKGDFDVPLCINHDLSREIMRSSNPNLKIEVKEDGVYVDCQLDLTDPEHKVIYDDVQRGEYEGFSFNGGVRYKDRDAEEREVVGGHVREISLVTKAAYPATYAAARSADSGELAEANNKIKALETDVASLKVQVNNIKAYLKA